MIWLSEMFSQRLPGPWCSVDDAMSVEGKIYRSPAGANRRTLRFELGGKGYFLKLHWGVGWREIFKNLLSLRLPVTGAANEWRAIQRLQEIGVETMHLEAYGQEGWIPARRKSFVVTRELENTNSLEDYCAGWAQQPPPFAQKKRLIKRVAQMTRQLHRNGVNHRDLYICHFLLQQPWNGDDEDLHLYLIDLHRVQLRKAVPRRWLVKDIGSLYFSAMDIGLTQRDLLRFLRAYHDQPLRQL
ncbi:MAG TPA: lipopolysaccharide core heptose(I) kinase RfaP, partial [Thiolapillus brandeum]|nr:lipopolysaccharide core heptose(I) kinase RfaP [Thiolapillus brandeum]